MKMHISSTIKQTIVIYGFIIKSFCNALTALKHRFSFHSFNYMFKTVYPKMYIPSFTHPHVATNPFAVIFSVEHKREKNPKNHAVHQDSPVVFHGISKLIQVWKNTSVGKWHNFPLIMPLNLAWHLFCRTAPTFSAAVWKAQAISSRCCLSSDVTVNCFHTRLSLGSVSPEERVVQRRDWHSTTVACSSWRP